MSVTDCSTCTRQVLRFDGKQLTPACSLVTCNWQLKLPPADPWTTTGPGRGHVASFKPEQKPF